MTERTSEGDEQPAGKQEVEVDHPCNIAAQSLQIYDARWVCPLHSKYCRFVSKMAGSQKWLCSSGAGVNCSQSVPGVPMRHTLAVKLSPPKKTAGYYNMLTEVSFRRINGIGKWIEPH